MKENIQKSVKKQMTPKHQTNQQTHIPYLRQKETETKTPKKQFQIYAHTKNK